MQFDKRLGIGLLSAGMALTCTALARGEDKPPAGGPPPGERPEGREGREGRPGGGGGRPEGREGFRPDPRRMLERMDQQFEGLNLSDDQKAKIKKISEKAKADLDA